MVHKDIFIEAEELLGKIDDPNLRVFDTKIAFYLGMSPEDAAKMPSAHEQYLGGHIPGAAFLDHQLFSDPISAYEYTVAPDHMLAKEIGESGIGNDSEVVVYAPHIVANATRAWWVLRYCGVENVRILDGGLAAWQAAGGELETGERKYEPTTFNAKFNKGMFASMEEVQAAAKKPDVEVQNVLPQEWHDREHIPGSYCLPLMNFGDKWEWFPAHEKVAARVADTDPKTHIITYCGGGIAATVNAVAYLMMGHDNVAVYDGSLFEWVGEGQPVEKSE